VAPRKPSDDPPVGEELAGTIPRLILRSFAMVEADLLHALRAAGARGVRPGHLALFRVLDRDGAQVSELARRMGVTRQAVSQTVDQLEAQGLLVREPHPDDGRARVVRYTAAGVLAMERGVAVLLQLEAEYARRLGPGPARSLRAALTKLLESG
jgi:DNA-binding MarR family transcriptional regulator